MSQCTQRAQSSAWLDKRHHIKICSYYSDPSFVTEEQGVDPSGSPSLHMKNGLSSLKPFRLIVFCLNKASCILPRGKSWKVLWRRKWQPTPVSLPGKSHGQRSLAGNLSSKQNIFQLDWRYACCAKLLQSCPTLCYPMDHIACQAPLSMGFSRQEYRSGLPCLPPEDLPDPGIEPVSLVSPTLAGRFFTTSAIWEGGAITN